MSKKIVSFYKFKKLNNIDNLRNIIFRFMKKNSILGTIILAKEGVNINICGDSASVDNAKDFIQTTLDLKIDHFNECNIDKDAFSKLKVKIKDEIIKVGFSASDCRMNSNKYLNPEEWNEYINNGSVVIDTRNKFEYLMGTFSESKSLNLTNFSDFKENFKSLQLDDKKQNYLIFCTGGIRCEKASIIMKELGYENVFQLKGGILNYLKSKKNESKWEGECFVFDDRISI